MATIILDAGHGGNDIGDAYGFRYEKDDNLRLTLAVGNELEKYGYNVEYIRISDKYLSQNDRVNIVNSLSGCLLLSIHRMIGEPLGFNSYSLSVILEIQLFYATDVPALMMGIGNLNSDYDNYLFDNRLNEFATAIATGIYYTIPVDN